MGFYFRKSKSLGPIRLNFSKSGVGVSTGVTGARLIFSPKGTYVHLGRHGLYYKKKISFGSKSSSNKTVEEFTDKEATFSHDGTIETINFDSLTDVDSQDFINELETKDSKVAFTRLFIMFGLIGLIIMSVLFFTPEQHFYKNVKYAVIKKDVVNIRESNSVNSNVVLQARRGQEFKIVNDTSDLKWLSISYNGENVFVFKDLTNQIEKTETIGSLSRYEKNPMLTYVSYSFSIILLIFFSIKLRKVDRKRKSVEIFYELDDYMNEIYDDFIRSFGKINIVSKIWQVYSKSSVRDSKYYGGASSVIKRDNVKEILGHKLPTRFFMTNAAIPYIRLRNVQLFFLPERLLVKKGHSFAAVMYKNLKLDSLDTQFIEDESVPSDAKIIDYTWRYVNKKGGPDKRFNNNKKIPICLYTSYYLESDNGINERIMTSKTGGLDDFENVIRRIKNMQANNSEIEINDADYKPHNNLAKLIKLLYDNDFIKTTDVQTKLSCGFSQSNKLIGLLLQIEAIVHYENDNYKIIKENLNEIEKQLVKHFG